MTQTAERSTGWAEAFARRLEGRRGPAWVEALRREAFARFEADGFPRPTDESWRQTNVAPIAATRFERPDAPTRNAGAELPLAAALADSRGPRLVLEGGRLAAADPDPGAGGPGVLAPLSDGLADAPEGLEPLLGRVAEVTGRPFAALNTALWEDGALVRIPAGTVLPHPVQVVHVTAASGSGAAVASHPRTLIEAGEGVEAIVVESYVGRPSGPALTNAVTELVLGRGAVVHHVRVVDEGSAWHVGAVQALQARDSRLLSYNLCLGATLTRVDLGSKLDGEGAEAVLYGLYLADGRQHVDNRTALAHARPHCPSRELYKGILSGAARAVFHGRILVAPDAQKTDAKQSNRNLLLSGEATVHTRPQLEIYANDVRCTHGATIGRLDDEAMFYLRSRGLGADQARTILIQAFADEILDKLPLPVLRERIGREVAARLHLSVAAAERA